MLEKVSAQNRGNIARPRNISHLLDISTIIFTGATDVFRTILRGQQTIPYYLRRMYNRYDTYGLSLWSASNKDLVFGALDRQD